MKKLMPAVVVAALAASQPACYGSYGAFNKVHKWNGEATSSGVANSAIHFAFWIIPVYELVLLGDVLIFNNVEFATGSNPFQ